MAFPVYDKKEDIPKGFEDEYEERDGKWRLKDQGAALKTALDEERGKREAAEKLAQKASGELADLKTKQSAAEKGVTSEQLEQLRKDVRADLEKEYGPKLKRGEELEAENRRFKLDTQIKKLAGEEGILAERLDDFWTLYGGDYDLTDDGKPMVKGSPGIDPKKRVAEQVKKQPGWKQGSKADGSGLGGDQTTTVPAGAIDEKALLKDPTAAIAAGNQPS